MGHSDIGVTVNLTKGHTTQSSHIRQRALPPESSSALFFIYAFITIAGAI